LHPLYQFKLGQTIFECDDSTVEAPGYLPTYWKFDSMIYTLTNMYGFDHSVQPKVGAYYYIPLTSGGTGNAPTIL